MIMVYITCANGDEAWTLAHKLVENKLAACAVTWPVRSLYWWKGQMESSAEHVLLVKTKNNLFNKLKKKVEELHSYETPCIIRLDSKAAPDYDKWVSDVLK